MKKRFTYLLILPLNGRSKSRRKEENQSIFPQKKKCRTAMGDTSFHLFRKTEQHRGLSSKITL